MGDFLLVNADYRCVVADLLESHTQVDCILTDPPYGVSRKHQLGFSNMKRFGMDYGDWDYHVDHKQWILDCLPALKEGGSIIIFNDWKNFSYLVEVLESASCCIKDLLQWKKNNPMPRNTQSRYVSDCEFAIWAVKGHKKWTFNKPAHLPYLRATFTGSLILGKNRIHPTQKSLEVMEQIIQIHTHEHDLVFDPFSGSATTALACLKHHRQFIGSEVDEKYHAAAMKRIEVFKKNQAKKRTLFE